MLPENNNSAVVIGPVNKSVHAHHKFCLRGLQCLKSGLIYFIFIL